MYFSCDSVKPAWDSRRNQPPSRSSARIETSGEDERQICSSAPWAQLHRQYVMPDRDSRRRQWARRPEPAHRQRDRIPRYHGKPSEARRAGGRAGDGEPPEASGRQSRRSALKRRFLPSRYTLRCRGKGCSGGDDSIGCDLKRGARAHHGSCSISFYGHRIEGPGGSRWAYG